MVDGIDRRAAHLVAVPVAFRHFCRRFHFYALLVARKPARAARIFAAVMSSSSKGLAFCSNRGSPLSMRGQAASSRGILRADRILQAQDADDAGGHQGHRRKGLPHVGFRVRRRRGALRRHED